LVKENLRRMVKLINWIEEEEEEGQKKGHG
jgi:hypothetical protein